MPPKKADPVFAWETIGQARDAGLEDLIALHDEEVGFPGQPPLDVDWDACLAAERVGKYRSVSVRLAGKLVGYRSFFVETSVNHRTVLFAINHALYVDPDHRRSRIGPNLIKVSDEMLKAKGVKIVLQANRGKLGNLLHRLGYGPMETVHAKRL